jgi:G3E family GTPase
LVLESFEPVDLKRLFAFTEVLLVRIGDALLRYQGVLAIVNEPRCLVLQRGLYSSGRDGEWEAGEAHGNVLMFIGDDLPEDEIREVFAEVIGQP